MTGSHSVILSPDSVNRVTPPTTTMKNTRPEEMYNHLATAGVVRIGSASLRVSECVLLSSEEKAEGGT